MKVRYLKGLASAARFAMSGAEGTRGKAYDIGIKRILGHVFVVYEGVGLHGHKNKGQEAVMNDKNLQVFGDSQIRIGMMV